jgi:hypothetical protein
MVLSVRNVGSTRHGGGLEIMVRNGNHMEATNKRYG